MKGRFTAEAAADARADRAALRKLFPRGRFALDSDGSCIMVARQARKRNWRLFLVSPGKTVGLYYEQAKRPEGLFRKLRPLTVKILDGELDGVLHLRWAPELERLLPEFSKGLRKGSKGPLCPPSGAPGTPISPSPDPEATP